ncbi:MAG: hypothetical protein LUG62_00765 [Clostridiales bacterium]|nr:hypothetical protein [Clostridiales bacterium]
MGNPGIIFSRTIAAFVCFVVSLIFGKRNAKGLSEGMGSAGGKGSTGDWTSADTFAFRKKRRERQSQVISDVGSVPAARSAHGRFCREVLFWLRGPGDRSPTGSGGKNKYGS